MNLGAFSISLSVKDLNTSKAFYEKLGFEVFAGDLEKNYLIMKNRDTLIGLFHGMFEGNIMTFNPGWDQNANTLEKFDDIRLIHGKLAENLPIEGEIETESGPGNFMITDPDGNQILIDQHV